MKPFLVSYRTHAVVLVAEAKIDARDFYIAKFLTDAKPDKRTIKVAELSGLEWGGPALSKPKVLKGVVLVDGGEG